MRKIELEETTSFEEAKMDTLHAVLYDIFLYGDSDPIIMKNLQREYDHVIGAGLIKSTINNLDIKLDFNTVRTIFSKHKIKIT